MVRARKNKNIAQKRNRPLWSRLRSSAPELQVAATLRPFPGESAAAALSHVALVEMSWNRKGGPGTEVFVYRF